MTRRLESLRRRLVPTIYAAAFPAASTSIFARGATEWRTLIGELAGTAEHALRSGEGHAHFVITGEELLRWLKLAEARLLVFYKLFIFLTRLTQFLPEQGSSLEIRFAVGG